MSPRRGGSDRLNPEIRHTGRSWREPVLQFGELLHARRAGQEGYLAQRLSDGRYIGHNECTGSVMIMSGGCVSFGMGVSRRDVERRWPPEGLADLRRIHGTSRPDDRSTASIAFFLRDHLLKAGSHLQSTVSLSSCDAEYYACAPGAGVALGAQAILSDWGVVTCANLATAACPPAEGSARCATSCTHCMALGAARAQGASHRRCGEGVEPSRLAHEADACGSHRPSLVRDGIGFYREQSGGPEGNVAQLSGVRPWSVLAPTQEGCRSIDPCVISCALQPCGFRHQCKGKVYRPCASGGRNKMCTHARATL